MTTHQIDARTLRPGETFYRSADPTMPLRVVRRTRQVIVGSVFYRATEIMHGDINHPGGLEYTVFPYGWRCLVPGFTSSE